MDYSDNSALLTEIKQEDTLDNVAENAYYGVQDIQIKSEETYVKVEDAGGEEISFKSSKPYKSPLEITIGKYEEDDKNNIESKELNRDVLFVKNYKDAPAIKVHKCELCAYETTKKKLLKSHTLIHKRASEVRMYKCANCSYQTKRKDSLKQHALKHKDASEIEMHKCELCAFQTKYRRQIKKHMLSVHKIVLEAEIYKCGICTYETKRGDYFAMHTSVHEGTSEKGMYKCDVCAYETKDKAYIKTHVRNVHVEGKSEGAKTFKCEACSFQTRYNCSLKCHTLTHS